MKKYFLGSRDPNRISLENVFPVGNLIFSTPIEAVAGNQLQVVVEGDQEYLDYFGDHASRLLKHGQDESGRWTALMKYLDSACIELIYEPNRAEGEIDYHLRLLVFGLRADLVQVCNLRLSPVALVTGTKGHITVLYERAPLPEGIGNGILDFIPHNIVPPRKKLILN